MRGPLGYTIAREFVSMARDPGMRRMLLAAPLLQVLVFTYAATMEVHNVALAVVNQDSGRWSRELVIRLEAAGFVDQVIHAPTTTALADLIERRQVLLAVHFQPDFSRRIEAGQSGPVQLLFDGRRANAGQIVFPISAILPPACKWSWPQWVRGRRRERWCGTGSIPTWNTAGSLCRPWWRPWR